MPWDISNYNTNPDLNTLINGHFIGEGSDAADYDDALRQMMADIATWTQAYAVVYPIAVNKGGTGAITAAAARTNLGALSDVFQRLPQTAKSSGFALAAGMDGGHIRYTGAATGMTVPTGLVQDFTALLVNDGSGAIAIARDPGVAMIWAATNADGNRSLAPGGMATIIQVATNRFFISGTGLS